MPPFYHLLIMSSRRCKDFIYIVTWGNQNVGVIRFCPYRALDSPVIPDYPGCRFACPGLSARWAFSPLYLITPRTRFCTSNWTPYKTNSLIRQFVKIFMNIAGYSWQFLTTSPSACGPIQSTGVKQI